MQCASSNTRTDGAAPRRRPSSRPKSVGRLNRSMLVAVTDALANRAAMTQPIRQRGLGIEQRGADLAIDRGARVERIERRAAERPAAMGHVGRASKSIASNGRQRPPQIPVVPP